MLLVCLQHLRYLQYENYDSELPKRFDTVWPGGEEKETGGVWLADAPREPPLCAVSKHKRPKTHVRDLTRPGHKARRIHLLTIIY